MPGGAEVGAPSNGPLPFHGDLLCIPNPAPPIGLLTRKSGAMNFVSDTNTLMKYMGKRMNKAWATSETQSAHGPIDVFRNMLSRPLYPCQAAG
jgi:hypothetical protein